MSFTYKSLPVAALIAFGLVTPSFALTPEDAWTRLYNDISSATSAQGGTFAHGAPQFDRDTLIVPDVTLETRTFAPNGEELRARLHFNALHFAPLDRSTVTLMLPETAALALTDQIETLDLELYTGPHAIHITQENDAPRYSGTFESIGLRSTPATLMQNGTLNLDLGLNQVVLTATSGATAADLSLNAQTLNGRLGGSDAEGFSFNMTLSAATPVITAAYSGETSTPASLNGTASYALGASTFTLQTKEAGQIVVIAGDVESAASQLTFSAGNLTQVSNTRALTVNVDEGLGVSIGSLTSTATVPFTASASAQPFQLGATIANLQLSETLWSMIDASGTLPRSPAAFNLALSGDLLLDEATLLGQGSALPTRLSLDALSLSALGASITGSGQVTAPPSTKIDPMLGAIPPVTGSFTFTLNGLTSAAQNLAQAGLLAPDMLMGLNMMLGMFATPSGPDSYTSTIGLSNGSLSLNGMSLN